MPMETKPIHENGEDAQTTRKNPGCIAKKSVLNVQRRQSGDVEGLIDDLC